MNELSFVIAAVFYLVMLGLITYWLAYQTVRVIKSMQEIKTSRQQAKVRVEVLDPQTLPFPEDQQAGHFSRQRS